VLFRGLLAAELTNPSPRAVLARGMVGTIPELRHPQAARAPIGESEGDYQVPPGKGA